MPANGIWDLRMVLYFQKMSPNLWTLLMRVCYTCLLNQRHS